MKIYLLLLGFIPWIIFSLLCGNSAQEMMRAAIFAAIAMVVFDYRYLFKGFWLPVMSLICFVLIACNYYFNWFIWGEAHPAILVNWALAAIVWLSVIFGKPFTLQYAKLEVKNEYWKSPIFFRVNLYLSMMWGTVLTLSALPTLLIPQDIYVRSWWWNYGFSSLLIIVAIYLNKFFREYLVSRNFWQVVTDLPPVNSRFLQSGYKPVHEEVELSDLTVCGEIPVEFNGSYLRNGPNPYFMPYTYTYPIDGDGMIHRIKIVNGRVTYKNAFVKTGALLQEIKVGKALFPGVQLFSIPLDLKSLSGLNSNKNTASIHVVNWQDKILAFSEFTAAYVLDLDLNTIGEWKLDGISALPVNGHFRADESATYMFSYNIYKSSIMLYKFDADKNFVSMTEVDKQFPTMINDFILTKNYVVIFDAPAIFDIKDDFKTGKNLSFHPELPLEIIMIKRDDHTIQVIKDIPSFFVYHFINAFEQDGKIIIDFVYHQYFNLDYQIRSYLYRGVIDLCSLTYSHSCLNSNFKIEFPSYNLTYTAKPYRYAYFPARTVTEDQDETIITKNIMLKYDFVNNTLLSHDFGANIELGEMSFVAKNNAVTEDDGYLIGIIYNNVSDTSDFMIIDAKDLSKVVATVKLPIRVPHGLHGSWNPVA